MNEEGSIEGIFQASQVLRAEGTAGPRRHWALTDSPKRQCALQKDVLFSEGVNASSAKRFVT